MAELTERCGVCAKCQWTCADQPDQLGCYYCRNGVGSCFFQQAGRSGKWDCPPCEKPQPAAPLTERCGDCAACKWTCADQPGQPACYFCRNGGGSCKFQIASSRGKWIRPLCQKPRTFDLSAMDDVLENKTRQPESVRKSNFTASIDDVAPDSLVDLRAGARSSTRRGRRRRPTARPSANGDRR